MKKNLVTNPIISGFNPDPNVLRVGKDYYIAVSTFEWLPGVRIYHSQNLVNWEYYTDIITDQVCLKGNPIGGSIWAPQLSYSNGLYYLVFTNVKSTGSAFKDCHNYYIVSESLLGKWSDPTYLNSSGFDPSIFHDDDGKSWLLNEIWDYRLSTPNKSSGIILQELSLEQGKLVGSIFKIFDGTKLAKTEAPLIYKINNYYYLITAEGGTGRGHSVTVCRSEKITGPYEVDEKGPLLTASDKPNSYLQCTGHASLVKNDFNQWFIIYLCTRPIDGEFAILGRETAIQEVVWRNGWLYLKNNGNGPDEITEVLTSDEVETKKANYFSDDFSNCLKSEWNAWKNLPAESWCQPLVKGLQIISGESVQSPFDAHILAIRQKDFKFEVKAIVEFDPKSFNEMAGLILYLNESKYLYLYLTLDEKDGTVLRLLKNNANEITLFEEKISVSTKVELGFKGDYGDGQFLFRDIGGKDDNNWQIFGETIDIRFLSGGFTGNYVGITVQSLDKFGGTSAQFNQFEYLGKD